MYLQRYYIPLGWEANREGMQKLIPCHTTKKKNKDLYFKKKM